MNPTTLFDLVAHISQCGSSHRALRLARETGAVLIVATEHAAANLRAHGVKARAIDASLIGVDPAPIIIDPAVLEAIARSWQQDRADMGAASLDVRAKLGAAEIRVAELEALVADAPDLRRRLLAIRRLLE